MISTVNVFPKKQSRDEPSKPFSTNGKYNKYVICTVLPCRHVWVLKLFWICFYLLKFSSLFFSHVKEKASLQWFLGYCLQNTKVRHGFAPVRKFGRKLLKRNAALNNVWVPFVDVILYQVLWNECAGKSSPHISKPSSHMKRFKIVWKAVNDCLLFGTRVLGWYLLPERTLGSFTWISKLPAVRDHVLCRFNVGVYRRNLNILRISWMFVELNIVKCKLTQLWVFKKR